MGFTTPCFILKNTLQLRAKLEGLGYRIGNKYCIDNNFLATDNNEMFGIEEPYLPEECNGYIHCGFNEELFLAIASLRDDTIICNGLSVRVIIKNMMVKSGKLETLI